jgi:general secretion pathway protein G
MTMNHKSLLPMKKAAERGMTLIEIMIVVSIIAMVAAGVAVVAIPKMKEAQVQSAETGARVIRNAVSQWQLAENEYGECPTVSQLVEDKQLDAGQTTVDPWGQEYEVTCGEEEVVVSSSGPDKKKGNTDDIIVPKGAAVPEGE